MIIQIQNPHDETTTVRIFESKPNETKVNVLYQGGVGINVLPPGVIGKQFSGMLIVSSNEDQLSEIIELPNGQFRPIDYRSAQAFSRYYILQPDVEFKIDGNNFIKLQLLPDSEIVFAVKLMP